MSYQITTLDVCVSGFERLRNQDEFILLASIDANTTASDLQEQWLADIQSCDRFDGFDYAEAERAVKEYVSANLVGLFGRRRNPFCLEHGREDIGIVDEGEGCTAFLYVQHN